MMKIFFPMFTITGIGAIVYAGIKMWGAYHIFGIIIPYVCFAFFIVGFISRILKWAAAPVPFHIVTVCGQQRSLDWIKPNTIESPASGFGVFLRMLGEIFLFRSLFRNDRVSFYGDNRKIIFSSDKLLWLGGIVFHWSLFLIVIRHLRFFMEPVPNWIIFLQNLDGVFQTTMPSVYISDVLVSISLLYLFLRRLRSRLRYISLAADYFALFLIGGIVLSGILLRHLYRVDLLEVKAFAMGLLYLKPLVYAGLGAMFYIHIVFVSLLIMYFPYSKLMHMAGVFLCPTRNLRNDSRMKRHVNPWDYPVKEHTYEEWEDEFRDALKEAGIPLDSENKG